MRKIIITLIAAICINSNAAESETKTEVFSGKHGAVKLRSSSEVGFVSSRYGDRVSVHVHQAQSSTEDVATYLISIRITEKGVRERSESAQVRFDEIDSLVSGIDYLKSASQQKFKFEDFEVEYATDKDLEITAFKQKEGGIGYVVAIGKISPARAFISLDSLDKLRAIILTAKSKLESVRK